MLPLQAPAAGADGRVVGDLLVPAPGAPLLLLLLPYLGIWSWEKAVLLGGGCWWVSIFGGCRDTTHVFWGTPCFKTLHVSMGDPRHGFRLSHLFLLKKTTRTVFLQQTNGACLSGVWLGVTRFLALGTVLFAGKGFTKNPRKRVGDPWLKVWKHAGGMCHNGTSGHDGTLARETETTSK